MITLVTVGPCTTAVLILILFHVVWRRRQGRQAGRFVSRLACHSAAWPVLSQQDDASAHDLEALAVAVAGLRQVTKKPESGLLERGQLVAPGVTWPVAVTIDDGTRPASAVGLLPGAVSLAPVRVLPASGLITAAPESPAPGSPPRTRVQRRPIAWLKEVRGDPLDILVGQDEVVIGRGDDCGIVLREDTVSRKHCTLLFRGGYWYISPFSTANGTFVNNEPATPGVEMRLRSRDLIGIGPEVVLRMTMPRAERVDIQLRAGGASSAQCGPPDGDHYVISPALIGVAAEVGGRASGGLAATIAIDVLRGTSKALNLRQLMPVINTAIRVRGEADPSAANMAAALDAMQLTEVDGAYEMVGVHIGDGFALVDDGAEVRWLTTPHTLGMQLASQNKSAEPRHADRPRLLRALGLNTDNGVDTWQVPADAGSRFVLGTEKIVSNLGIGEFIGILEEMRGCDPRLVASLMVDRAARDLKADQLSIVVADVVQQEGRHREDREPIVSATDFPAHEETAGVSRWGSISGHVPPAREPTREQSED